MSYVLCQNIDCREDALPTIVYIIITAKTNQLFQPRVVTLVADKLETVVRKKKGFRD